MAVADRQILGELVDCADVAVRSASQLQLFKLGRPLHDQDALKRTAVFLEAAAGGGKFMFSGDTGGLQATLRPLNWAADVWSSRGDLPSGEEAHEVDYYKALTEFLQEMQSTVNQVAAAEQPRKENLDKCIQFFDSLGEVLGTRADQHMRRASAPCSALGAF